MLKQIQKVTKSAITQRPIPTAEQINNKKFKDMINEVKETINKGELTKFMPSAIELTESYDPLSIIAALMKIKFEKESVFDYSSNKLE